MNDDQFPQPDPLRTAEHVVAGAVAGLLVERMLQTVLGRKIVGLLVAGLGVIVYFLGRNPADPRGEFESAMIAAGIVLIGAVLLFTRPRRQNRPPA